MGLYETQGMQTSTQILSAATKNTLEKNFATVFADLKTISEVQAFLQDFLTETERAIFAKRLGVAVLLQAGKSYEEIQKILGVSSATISTVMEMMEKKGVQLALQKIADDQWAEKWSDRLLGLFSSH